MMEYSFFRSICLNIFFYRNFSLNEELKYNLKDRIYKAL